MSMMMTRIKGDDDEYDDENKEYDDGGIDKELRSLTYNDDIVNDLLFSSFSDVINAKRREQQEKLAEKAIEDARQQQQQLLASQSSKINGKGGINNGFSMAKSSSFSVSLPPLREGEEIMN